MSKTRVSATVASCVLVPGILLAGAAAPAMADAPATAAPAPAVNTKFAPAPGQDVRSWALARYGVHPLPMKYTEIKKYHLTRKQVREIVKAKKLANSATGIKVRRLESGNNYKYNDGHYYGAWNFDAGTWLSNGGGKYGRTANKAPKWAQDYIMWKTHNARGWSPWSTA